MKLVMGEKQKRIRFQALEQEKLAVPELKIKEIKFAPVHKMIFYAICVIAVSAALSLLFPVMNKAFAAVVAFFATVG